MITGDYEVTAISIASELGIKSDSCGKIYSGADVDDMSDGELARAAEDAYCFYRANPAHKVRGKKKLHIVKENSMVFLILLSVSCAKAVRKIKKKDSQILQLTLLVLRPLNRVDTIRDFEES